MVENQPTEEPGIGEQKTTPNAAPPSPEAADIDTLLAEIERKGLWMQPTPGVYREIGKALQKFPGDTEALVEWLFARMLRFDAQFLLRAQLVVTDATTNYWVAGPHPDKDVHHDIKEVWLPRIARIEDRLLTIMNAYAKAKHVLAMAKGDHVNNGPDLTVLPSMEEVEPVAQEA